MLRGWRDSDLDAFTAMSADAGVMRFIGGVGDREQAWGTMAVHAGHWTLRGYGLWVVQRHSDGVVLGRVGLWEPEGWPGLELGWGLVREAWGHGYATETARAAMRWAWDVLGAPRLISVIDPRNEPSQRVARRLGMAPLREWVLRGETEIIWGIERPTAALRRG